MHLGGLRYYIPAYGRNPHAARPEAQEEEIRI